MEMRFLPDEPIDGEEYRDDLGFDKFVEVLQTSIYNTQAPFVYGVLGDWGTGKTSIMKLLQNRFEKEMRKPDGRPYIPIWFDAWKYENEDNIVYPLLYAIKRDYDVRIRQQGKSSDFPKKFAELVASSALALTDVGLRVATKHLTGEALKLADIKEQIKTVKENAGNLEMVLGGWADEVRKLDEAFLELLDLYARDLTNPGSTLKTQPDKVRFVILIDDLDRCLPDTTIDVLESIKNYLMVKNCIFVLAVNPKIIYQGIRIKYKNLEVDGREYLEKILNYSFYVPEPELDKVAKFTTDRLQKLLAEADWQKYENYCVNFGQVLQKCFFTNPRKIKRILNRYLFFISRYESELDQYDTYNLVKLLVLAEYFPALFQLFLSNADRVVGEMEKVGTPQFDIQKFENQFGVSIAATYPQLLHMKDLFSLEVQTVPDKPDLTKQAQAVLSITRLI